MKILTSGTTRYVICIGNVVVKIARIPSPLWCIFRFFHWWKRGCVIEKLAKTHPFIPLAVLLYFRLGIVANWEEYWFYRKNSELPLAPTVFTFFGLVNIALRGEPIKEEEIPSCPFRKYADMDIDLRKAEHFGRINHKICLLDYGSSQLNNLLKAG